MSDEWGLQEVDARVVIPLRLLLFVLFLLLSRTAACHAAAMFHPPFVFVVVLVTSPFSLEYPLRDLRVVTPKSWRRER